MLNTRKFISLVAVCQAPADPDNIYVAEQTGEIYKINLKTGKDDLFLKIDGVVELSPFYDERGLLGFVFDDNYEKNGFLYTYHSIEKGKITDLPEDVDHIGVLTRHFPQGHSEIIFIIFEYTSIHNGGSLSFFKDKLYLSLGDGGPQEDPENRAQNPNNVHGKILEIDVYSDPLHEIFQGGLNDLRIYMNHIVRFYAMGFRNPRGLSFDNNGFLYVTSAGYNSYEEIDVIIPNEDDLRRKNYGWNVFEGKERTPWNSHLEINEKDYVEPYYTYETPRKSFIGGPLADGGAIVGGVIGVDGNFYYSDYAGFVGIANGEIVHQFPNGTVIKAMGTNLNHDKLYVLISRAVAPKPDVFAGNMSEIFVYTIDDENSVGIGNGKRKIPEETEMYDYIIIGAGTAGCVIAGKLIKKAEELRILIIEAGDFPNELSSNPHNYLKLFGEQEYFFDEISSDSNPILSKSGKIVGGGASVNGMLFNTNDLNDYDFGEWEDKFQPRFIKMINDMKLVMNNIDMPAKQVIVETLVANGFTYRTDGFINGKLEGVGPTYQFINKKGERVSSFTHYIGVDDQKITIETGKMVDKLSFDKGLVTVEITTGRQFYTENEVIVCAGGIGSPRLLLKSGLLNPHIGKHLHDQPRVNILVEMKEGMIEEDVLPGFEIFSSLSKNYYVEVLSARGAADALSGLVYVQDNAWLTWLADGFTDVVVEPIANLFLRNLLLFVVTLRNPISEGEVTST